MASILEYRRNPNAPRKTAEITAPCQIIRFPGVRYERWSEPVKPAGKPKRPRRKRSR